MAILNRFKKKKKEEKIEKKEVTEPKAKKVEIPSTPKEKKGKEISLLAWQALKSPHITEKATDLVKKNQYVFKVWSGINKTEIKKAIEDLYGIDVTSVKIIKIPPKQRRLGRISGWRSGYKKAIVKIKEGQKIEVLPR